MTSCSGTCVISSIIMKKSLAFISNCNSCMIGFIKAYKENFPNRFLVDKGVDGLMDYTQSALEDMALAKQEELRQKVKDSLEKDNLNKPMLHTTMRMPESNAYKNIISKGQK